MKAWLIDALTGIEHLRPADVPAATAQSGEAVVELRFAALNPADRYLAEGQYPALPRLPHILGRDGLGTIVQVGPGVTDLRVGDRRAILRGDVGVTQPGTFAERVAVPAQNLVEIPPGWSDEEAAGATLVYLTAYQALTAWGTLPVPSVVLVTGASGGVGVASVQLAAAMGHTVLALSRSGEKAERLRQLGANATFNPEDPQWRKAVSATLAPRKVDLAIDNIGGKLLPQVIDTLGDHGRVSLVGRLAGPVPNFNTAALFFRRIRLGGVAVGAYSNAESRSAWAQVLQLLARNGARPLVDRIFPFEQLPAAFERLKLGPMGKVLLEVRGHPAGTTQDLPRGTKRVTLEK
jgi:NADPH2:quinone reductase